jgi:uncharacterized protein
MEGPVAWLLREGQVLASVSLAATLAERARGFAARADGDGALFCAPAHMPHSLGAKTDLDVAWVDSQLCVLGTSRLTQSRVGMWRRGAAGVLEAEAGAFERWALRPGDVLEIRQ